MNRALGPKSVLFLRHPDGDWLVGWGAMERRAEPPSDRMAFYLPDFFTIDPSPWWVPEYAERMDRLSLESRFPYLAEPIPSNEPISWEGPDFAAFETEFLSILKSIENGEVEKAVPLAMTWSVGVPQISERVRLWQRTLNVPSRWMAYGGWWGDEGLIGLSPEILFFSQPGWTEAMALAGTASQEDSRSLLESEKDVHEHRVVAEDIRQQLKRFGVVKATPMREWSLGRLKHLRTDLAIEREVPFMDLVRALHPTPALGVAPRSKGLEYLARFPSGRNRRHFGAPFGVNLPGEFALCCVAIRGVQWHEGKTWLASGCGVVKGSELEREWGELELKRRVVQEQFGL